MLFESTVKTEIVRADRTNRPPLQLQFSYEGSYESLLNFIMYSVLSGNYKCKKNFLKTFFCKGKTN